VLEPASPDWARDFQRVALERPLEQQHRGDRGPSLLAPVLLFALLCLYGFVSIAGGSWMRGDWMSLVGLSTGTVIVAAHCGVPVDPWTRVGRPTTGSGKDQP
jgi:hypothetical protein